LTARVRLLRMDAVAGHVPPLKRRTTSPVAYAPRADGTGRGRMRLIRLRGPLVKATAPAIPFEDAALIKQCREGDSAAFGRLVAKYQDRVFNTCWRMCGNRADAEDFTQEAFVKAFQAIDRFAERSKFSTWVFRIAVNVVLSSRRGKKAKAVYSLDDSPGPASDASTSAAERAVSQESPPDGDASDRERTRIVAEALASLEEEHRTVVILRDLESFGYDEIAEILDVPAGTVKSRLHRARMALRDKLSPLLESV
jgi:RNA polymerase sigma-70 factor (ECF subfamily)